MRHPTALASRRTQCMRWTLMSERNCFHFIRLKRRLRVLVCKSTLKEEFYHLILGCQGSSQYQKRTKLSAGTCNGSTTTRFYRHSHTFSAKDPPASTSSTMARGSRIDSNELGPFDGKTKVTSSRKADLKNRYPRAAAGKPP